MGSFGTLTLSIAPGYRWRRWREVVAAAAPVGQVSRRILLEVVEAVYEHEVGRFVHMGVDDVEDDGDAPAVERPDQLLELRTPEASPARAVAARRGEVRVRHVAPMVFVGRLDVELLHGLELDAVDAQAVEVEIRILHPTAGPWVPCVRPASSARAPSPPDRGHGPRRSRGPATRRPELRVPLPHPGRVQPDAGALAAYACGAVGVEDPRLGMRTSRGSPPPRSCTSRTIRAGCGRLHLPDARGAVGVAPPGERERVGRLSKITFKIA